MALLQLNIRYYLSSVTCRRALVCNDDTFLSYYLVTTVNTRSIALGVKLTRKP